MQPEVLRFARLLRTAGHIAGDASDEEPEETSRAFTVPCNICNSLALYTKSDTEEEEVTYPRACPLCKRVQHPECAALMLDEIKTELPALLGKRAAPVVEPSWCAQLSITSFCCWCFKLLDGRLGPVENCLTGQQ